MTIQYRGGLAGEWYGPPIPTGERRSAAAQQLLALVKAAIAAPTVEQKISLLSQAPVIEKSGLSQPGEETWDIPTATVTKDRKKLMAEIAKVLAALKGASSSTAKTGLVSRPVLVRDRPVVRKAAQLRGLSAIASPSISVQLNNVLKIATKYAKDAEKYSNRYRKTGSNILKKAERTLKKNPVVTAVAMAAVTAFTGGAGAALFAGGGLGGSIGAGVAAVKGAMGASGILSTLGKTALKEGAKKAIGHQLKTKAKHSAEKAQKAAAVTAQKQAAQIQAEILTDLKTIITDKNFHKTAESMLKAGKSPQEIVDSWTQSAAYKQAAQKVAYNAAYPVAYEQAINAGMPLELAEQAASDAVAEVAKDTAQKAATPGWQKAALIVLPLLLAVAGG